LPVAYRASIHKTVKYFTEKETIPHYAEKELKKVEETHAYRER